MKNTTVEIVLSNLSLKELRSLHAKLMIEKDTSIDKIELKELIMLVDQYMFDAYIETVELHQG